MSNTADAPETTRYELEPGVVDLDAEEVHDSKGNRIDSDYVERAVADVHAKTQYR